MVKRQQKTLTIEHFWMYSNTSTKSDQNDLLLLGPHLHKFYADEVENTDNVSELHSGQNSFISEKNNQY